jgi:dienelactone hydrolase
MIQRICGAFVMALFLAGALGAETRVVEVTAADGAKLKASYYSPGKPGPGVLLLHQCDMNRAPWSSLAAALTERGIHVLAVDYRGYGDNRALPLEYPKLAGDIDAALAMLQSQPDVDRRRVGAGGASCGVDHAVQLARRSGQIKGLALLSGPTSDAGLQYIQTSNVPVFLAFSADEGGPLPKMKSGVSMSKNAATTVREFDHAGHGVPMFDAQPTLLAAVADWFVKVLASPGATGL